MLRVHLPQEELHRYSQIVSRGVSGRTTQPVQNNIYLEAREGQLRMVASDLEYLHLEAVVPAMVEEEGAATVPARLLVEVTGALPPAEVSLEAGEQNSLTVACQRTRYEMRGLPPEDFEMLPPLDGAVEFNISQKLLHRLLSRTIFAVLRDETRPILTGVHIKISPEQLEMVATDTYRLARCRVRPDSVEGLSALNVDDQKGAIVSARCLAEVERLLDANSEHMVTVAFTESLVEFQVDRVKVMSRLIEGRYPDYERVIPTEYQKTVLVRTADLEQALRRTLIVARDDGNRVVFHMAGQVMTLVAESQDVGRAEEEIEVEMEGEPMDIAFNARYLLDALDAMGSDRIRIDLTGPHSAGAITPEGDDTYLYVLMPMQLVPRR
ncbi:MAG: DNA polymerase III subunit beta [Armatimonadetes bacterium]|nr:DNA polymerase III subunit beta [Armatimonadota bacterium]